MAGAFQPNAFQPGAFQEAAATPAPAFQRGAFQSNAFQMQASISVGVTIDAPVGEQGRQLGGTHAYGQWKRPRVLRPIFVDLQLDAPILGSVRRAFVIDARIHVRTNAQMSVSSPIRGTAIKSIEINSDIFDPYDYNQEFLLGELDPDLLLVR